MLKNKINRRINARQLKKEYISGMLDYIEEYNTNGKKTVALFCDTYYPFIDGVISVIDNYAKRLLNYYNVIVCVPGSKNGYIKKEYPILWFKSYYFKMINYSVGRPYADLPIKALFKKLRVDLIHIHSPFMMGRFALNESRKRGIPAIATFHSQYKKDFKKIVKVNSVTNLFVYYIMHVFNRSDEVWTMNEATKQTLLSYKFSGKVNLMSNATDLTPPKDAEAFGKIARDKFGLRKGERIFCFVGRLIYLKNIILIAESLYFLKKKGVKFKMIYIGDGTDMAMLKTKISELNLTDEVIIAGRVMDRNLLGSVLYNSDLLLFPSIYDTDGIVKYEAAAYKTPTLFLKGSNASYDIIDNETGYICEGKPDIMADRLYEIINDEDNLKKVGENAYKKLYHTWDDIISLVANRYEELINTNYMEKNISCGKRKTVKKNAV